MKKLFENPKLEISVFETEDIINVSGGGGALYAAGAAVEGTVKTITFDGISSIFTGV